MISLLKVPFILGECLGMHVAATPPNPPPPSAEQVNPTGRESYMKNIAKWPTPFVKTLFWAGGIAETGVIVANHYPLAPYAKDVLSALVLTGSPDRIHISPLFVFGSLLTSFGGFIRFKCYRALGNFFTFELSIRKDHKLITNGPYSIVRHPSYTGAILAVSGAIIRHAAPGSWVRECGVLSSRTGQTLAALWVTFGFAIVLGLVIRAPKEDEMMKKEFGNEWTAWAQKVRYRLIPGIY